MDETPRIVAASDQSLLVRFGDGISPEHHRRVAGLMAALSRRPIPALRNLHPAYASLLVTFDPRQASSGEVTAWLRRSLEAGGGATAPGRAVEIPVAYGGPPGPDLEEVASFHGLTADQVIALHSGAEYLVYFLGFSPGFAYMGGLPPRLATPRLVSPRTWIPAGSVAIGGYQTGVYPLPSPGGWRVIGRTPLVLFDPAATPAARLRMGDRVRFRPIAPAEFERLEKSRSPVDRERP